MMVRVTGSIAAAEPVCAVVPPSGNATRNTPLGSTDRVWPAGTSVVESSSSTMAGPASVQPAGSASRRYTGQSRCAAPPIRTARRSRGSGRGPGASAGRQGGAVAPMAVTLK